MGAGGPTGAAGGPAWPQDEGSSWQVMSRRATLYYFVFLTELGDSLGGGSAWDGLQITSPRLYFRPGLLEPGREGPSPRRDCEETRGWTDINRTQRP